MQNFHSKTFFIARLKIFIRNKNLEKLLVKLLWSQQYVLKKSRESEDYVRGLKPKRADYNEHEYEYAIEGKLLVILKHW